MQKQRSGELGRQHRCPGLHRERGARLVRARHPVQVRTVQRVAAASVAGRAELLSKERSTLVVRLLTQV